MPREVAAVGPLDLDDARAKIRKLSRRKRRGDRLFDRDHGNACEGLHHFARLKPSRSTGETPSRFVRSAKAFALHRGDAFALLTLG